MINFLIVIIVLLRNAVFSCLLLPIVDDMTCWQSHQKTNNDVITQKYISSELKIQKLNSRDVWIRQVCVIFSYSTQWI